MLLNNGVTLPVVSGQQLPLAPQALAELVPQLATSYYYPDRTGLELERAFALYGEIYRAQPWVRAVIDKRAGAVARLPVSVWDVDGDTRTLDRDSPYAKLMARPCEFLSSNSFWFWVQAMIDIYGEAYLAIVKDEPGGKPVSFLPMHPSRVAIKRDPDTGRYTYTFQAGAGYGDGLVQFDQDDMVPFRLFHPNKLERGFSRMESIRSTIFAEDSSRNATSAMWSNSGRPNLVLTTDKVLGPVGRKRLKDSFQEKHAGSSNAGQTLVMEDGVKALPIQLTATEMQFIESRQLNRQEICGVYDVAETMVHIEDHSTFANIAAQMRAFYRDSMAVPIEFIQSTVDFYVGNYWQRQNVMRFNVDEVIRGDYEMRAEAGQHAVTSGGMTPNEYRELLGLNRSDDPKADKLYANAAMQPLGDPPLMERMTVAGQVADITQPRDRPLIAPPGSSPMTEIPSLNGGQSSRVPTLPTKPAPVPGRLMQPPKHIRAVKGALGRGQDIQAVATKLAQEHPDELEDILMAVKMAICEREMKEV